MTQLFQLGGSTLAEVIFTSGVFVFTVCVGLSILWRTVKNQWNR